MTGIVTEGSNAMIDGIDDAMRKTLDEIVELVGLDGRRPFRADVEIAFGSISAIRVVPADPSGSGATGILDGAYATGLRAMRRAGVHVMEERHDPDTGGYLFFVIKGRGYLGRIVRMVTRGDIDMVVLEKLEDTYHDIEHEANANEIHEVPRGETHGGRLRRIMTAVGDKVRIIHPHSPTSPVVLLNDSTTDLRMMSEV